MNHPIYAMWLEMAELTLREMECWKMYGLRVEFLGDEVYVEAP
jgi:hypothetical protein